MGTFREGLRWEEEVFEWEARSQGHECMLNVVKRTEAESCT
jgi:hypothetical protein